MSVAPNPTDRPLDDARTASNINADEIVADELCSLVNAVDSESIAEEFGIGVHSDKHEFTNHVEIAVREGLNPSSPLIELEDKTVVDVSFKHMPKSRFSELMNNRDYYAVVRLLFALLCTLQLYHQRAVQRKQLRWLTRSVVAADATNLELTRSVVVLDKLVGENKHAYEIDAGDGGLKNEDDEQPRADGIAPGRKSGHDPEWRDAPNPDQEIEVNYDCCPECGDDFDESEGICPRLVEEIPDPQPPEVAQYNRHRYECNSCGTEAVASHPDCPDGGQFGVNVIAQAGLSRYDHQFPYRKVADRFEQLHMQNCQARPRGTRPSAPRAPVAANTNASAARYSKLTLSTSTRPESDAPANKRGSGRSSPRVTRCT